jgi:ribosome maturation factor RimP
MTQVHVRERELQREIADAVRDRVPETDVLAVELTGPEHLVVYIDHPEGVDHSLCERVTGVLRSYLEHYTLDVSSPGLERPLRTQTHFESALGRRVAVRTATDVGGRRRFKGEVVAVGERETKIAVGEEEFGVPYDAIVRGNLIEER